MAKGTRASTRNRWPIAVLILGAATGFIFVASAISAGGSDLRPAGGDVTSLIQDRTERVNDKREVARDLGQQIEFLSSINLDKETAQKQKQVDRLKGVDGLTALEGPGVRITLEDAPRSVDIPGLDPNNLVVHQQDLQAFVNALWSGGAEAVTIQGQRLISTTGIKCVGNTVVLDGVPYAPPYVIEAIGPPPDLNYSLNTSAEVNTYASYAKRYQLGLKIQTLDYVAAAAYAGTVSLDFAAAID